MSRNLKPVSVSRNLKPQTLMLGDALNSPKEIDSSNISNGFDTPSLQNLAVPVLFDSCGSNGALN